jgi:hypothetical protein
MSCWPTPGRGQGRYVGGRMTGARANPGCVAALGWWDAMVAMAGAHLPYMPARGSWGWGEHLVGAVLLPTHSELCGWFRLGPAIDGPHAAWALLKQLPMQPALRCACSGSSSHLQRAGAGLRVCGGTCTGPARLVRVQYLHWNGGAVLRGAIIYHQRHGASLRHRTVWGSSLQTESRHSTDVRARQDHR